MKEKKKIRIITTTAVNRKEKTLFVPGSSSNNRSMRIEFCYKLNLLKGSFFYFKFKEEKKLKVHHKKRIRKFIIKDAIS